MFRLFCLMLLAYASQTSSERITNDCASEGKSIFILAGQSNMAGRGKLNELKLQTNPSILRLSPELTWEVAEEPLHKGIDPKIYVGVGPGLVFANSILEKDPNLGEIGLVPCAIGGTSISQWRRDADYYHNMTVRAHAALRDGGRIRAFLWYQGESDTEKADDANAYKSRLEELITNVRSDLNLPQLPVILVAISTQDKDGSFLDTIRKAQLDANNLPNVECVDSMGSEVSGDGVHLTTKGETRVGKLLADAFLKISRDISSDRRLDSLGRKFSKHE